MAIVSAGSPILGVGKYFCDRLQCTYVVDCQRPFKVELIIGTNLIDD